MQHSDLAGGRRHGVASEPPGGGGIGLEREQIRRECPGAGWRPPWGQEVCEDGHRGYPLVWVLETT
jgi:hypothetical protein